MNAASRNRERLLALIFACAAPPAFAQDTAVFGPRTPSTPDTPEIPPVTDADDQPGEKRGFFHRFIDEEDGGFDFSETLAKGGFMPVPIIITEPAVDGGFGLAAAFISESPDHPGRVTRTAVAGFKTGNGSMAMAHSGPAGRWTGG